MATFLITSSLMIAAVLAARFLLKNKVSFLVLYPLWGIVLLRLLVPVTFIESKVSVMNLIYVLGNARETPVSVAGNTEQQKENPQEEIINSNTGNAPVAGSKKSVNINISPGQNTSIKEADIINNKVIIPEESGKTERGNLPEVLPEKETRIPEKNLYNILTKSAIIIWVSGSIIFFMLLIISNIAFYKRLSRNRIYLHTSEEGINVFISEIINTPCIAGVLHPSVYLPVCYSADYPGYGSTKDKYMEQVLVHEYTHIRHKDNIWAFMRTICLGIYWFNPFVWIAAFYSRQDAELACDETVLKNCTNSEKYNYGKMLLVMSQKGKQNRFCFATGIAGSKKNLKERIIMLSNSNKKKFKKCHAVIIALITIIIAGCGLTREKASVHVVNPDNAVKQASKLEKTDSNGTSWNGKTKYKTEKIFQDFINNKIKSCPEWKKWKGNTNKLYFSIQYVTDNTPCLLVAKDIITGTKEAMGAFVYYYNKEQDKVQLLTYLASNGTAYPVSVKDGEFVIYSHHSVRNYSWDGDDSLSAQEVAGYFMNKEKYTYSSFSWKVPFKSKKLKLDARKFYSQGKIDACADETKKIKKFSKDKAKDFYKMYSDAAPVIFYINTEKNWNKFYNNGYLKENLHRVIWHGDYNDDNDNITKIVNGFITGIVNRLSFEDFIKAEKKSSVLIDGARLYYVSKFSSDENVLYFLNWGYTIRAFILRTGSGKQALYDVYTLNPSRWSREDIVKDNLSSARSPEIYLKLMMSKLGRADYDNDGEEEVAFYMTENPFTLDRYKTLYMFDKKNYGDGYEGYELYSYTKDDYRYFTEQVCINFDNAAGQGQYQQTKPDNYFADIKNKAGSSYESSKNIITGNKLSDYNYIITGKNYKNNYEFGSSNTYNIILEDNKTEIWTNIGICFNKKGENQKHNAEISALVQYKGNGKFVLKEPYGFKITD